MPANYPINSRVSVRITGFIASGLLGQVDGTKAIIRNREIAWHRSLPAREYVGQTREAIVLGFNPAYQELELSLRLAERDPWREAAQKYTFGTEVEGQVIGLIEEAAFVEIELGVEGFLPVSELLPQPVERIDEWLWVGDRVKAMVIDMAPARRRLRLSFKELLIQREARMQDKRWLRYQQTASEATLLAARLPKQIRMQLLQIERPVDTPAQATNLEVLVVEDDEVYGAALRDLLRCNGCEITWVRDSVTCLAEVNKRKRPFDLITIDWGLPDLKGHELMQLLQQGGCPSRLALLLNPEPLRDHPRIWDVLGNSGVDVFSKEDGDGCKIGLISVLRELRPDGFCSETPRRRYFPDITALSPKQSPSPLVVERSLLLPGQLESLQVLLTRLQRDTRATTVILLRLDLGRRRFLAEGYAGKPLPLEQAQPDLIYSPLADVLQMSQEVCERVASDSPRFRRLLDILPFQGFLGIPLPEVESPHRSGLFLIKEHGSFGLLDREQARAAAYLIEAWS